MQGFPVRASAREAVPPTQAEGVFDWPGPFALHHGGALEGVRFGWRIVGPEGAPIVLAIGGISAHRRVTAEDQGWWSELAGNDRPLDARRFRILGVDYLGSSGASSGPARGQGSFPSISSYDQAEAIAGLTAELRLGTLHAIVGASYGGMVALACAERHPRIATRLLVVSAAEHAHPMASAWRYVQREIVRLGLGHDDSATGLRIARALAMCTYRTPREFTARFAGPARHAHGRWRTPVEDYLCARGEAYAARNLPEAFLCLSESIDLHRVEAARVPLPVTAVAVREDQLVPLADMQALAARLPDAKLTVLDSIYGHDAFLKEPELLRPVFAACLEGSSR
jgi:homoserine O-acetyltransferase/O-succinyltransferase